MTPVEFKFVLPTGEPMANATVDIKLGRASHTGSLTGITMPRPITVQTDAAGKAVLSLWPSATAYFVEVLDAASEAGIFYKFLVPEVAPGVTVRLQDLVVDAPMSGVFYDDAALLAIHNSKVNARASELAAKDWAALAASKAQDMTSFVVATTANKDAAALSEFNANAKAVEAAASAAAALGSKNAAATSEANALASKNAAAGSATTAATKATEAASSATAADASKTAAGTSATNAANSATAAQASKDSAQTSATTATTKATEASSSATAAASSAATASTKATEAGNSANAAATSASQAAASAAAAAAAGVSSFNTRTGAVSLTQADVFAALGYTPYNATNPNGYITAAGNVATATKLATPRSLTLGLTAKGFDGSANVAWSLAEIGALPLAGGALTGDLATAGRVSLPNDAGTPGAHTGAARFGRFNREAGSAVLQLGGADNVRSFEVIDRDWTTVILGASMSAFTYKGNTVWHSGNLNPANYAPLTNPSLPGTFEVYGEAYIRSSFHVLNAAQNGWHTVINRNGGNPSVNAPGGISAPNAVLNRGCLPQGTDFNAVRAPGFYGVEMGSWSGLLLDLGGVGGSTPRMQFWATYGDELYFRAARDADTQFDGIGYAQNRIWHSGNFDAARPSFARVSCGFDPTVDQAIGCSNWFRSSGNSGWYNQTYGGGINMEDSTFVRVSHDKHFLCQQRLFGNGGGQGLGAITVSTAGPSGGRTGDIWIQY